VRDGDRVGTQIGARQLRCLADDRDRARLIPPSSVGRCDCSANTSLVTLPSGTGSAPAMARLTRRRLSRRTLLSFLNVYLAVHPKTDHQAGLR
jgi:hypothetical protein